MPILQVQVVHLCPHDQFPIPKTRSTSFGAPTCISWRTSEQSIPIPNATVAITIRSWESFVNTATILSFTIGSVQLMNMSTRLNLGRSGLFVCSVNSGPSRSLKNTYRSAQSSNRLHYVIVRGKACPSCCNLFTRGRNVSSQVLNATTTYMMLHLHGDIAITNGFHIPRIRMTSSCKCHNTGRLWQ